MTTDELQAPANFLGFERIGADGKRHRQPLAVRGNGTLTLTDSELRFVRALPRKEFVVPLARVTGVGTGRSHNGKWMGWYPVLKVAVSGDERFVGFEFESKSAEEYAKS